MRTNKTRSSQIVLKYQQKRSLITLLRNELISGFKSTLTSTPYTSFLGFEKFPEHGPGDLGHSPILQEAKPLSSPLAQVQPKRRYKASDPSSIQAISDLSQRLDADVGNSPVRIEAAVSPEALIEDSQGSLRNMK